MSKQRQRPLIRKLFIEAANKRVREVGRAELEKEMRLREPNLYSALCAISNQALADRPETLSDETQTVIYDALWQGAIVAVEAYRIAQHHLWAQTCLEPYMQRLDPDLYRRAQNLRHPEDDNTGTHE
jgi:hypothetical protein